VRRIEARGLIRRALQTGLVALAVLATTGWNSSDSALHPESHAAHDISQLWWGMFVGSVVVFAVVITLMLVAVLRRRGQPADAPDRSPRPVWPVALGGVAVPALVAVVLFTLTLRTLPSTAAPAQGKTRFEIDVTGRQWFWDVTYPSMGIRTANELHLPVGVPVRLRVTSADVIHSFWVPDLNRKIDMIPGRTNAITLEANRAGVYRGRCAEFCGVQHANMGFLVVAQPEAQFQTWARQRRLPAPEPQTDEQARGLQVLLGSACVYCHRIAGTNASGEIGPDLTHLASRQSIGAALLPNSKGYLAGWILDPQHWKPGNRMPATDLSGPNLQALLAYLESLK
jgi:cytochrome c oxidase subunit 2